MFVAIGCLFKYKQLLCRVVKSSSCNKCAFENNAYCDKLREEGLIPNCGESCRIDEKPVVFVAECNISQDAIDLD